MNWIKNFVRPKIRSILGVKREVPENMWVKDPDSGQMVFYKDLEANQFVMPQSNYHMRMPPEGRLKSMFDNGVFEMIAMPQVAADPLKFRDERKYADRIKEARAKTNTDDCILAGHGTLDETPVTIAVQDFAFMGGSLGMAAGEAIVTAMRAAYHAAECACIESQTKAGVCVMVEWTNGIFPFTAAGQFQRRHRAAAPHALRHLSPHRQRSRKDRAASEGGVRKPRRGQGDCQRL